MRGWAESAWGCGTRWRRPSPLPSALAPRHPAFGSGGGRGAVEKDKVEREEEELMRGRETFDRFVDCKERKLPRNEGVGGGGHAAGARRGNRPGARDARGGLWSRTARPADPGGHPSYWCRPRAARAPLSQPLPEQGRRPRPPLSSPAALQPLGAGVRGGVGEMARRRLSGPALQRSLLARVSEREGGGCGFPRPEGSEVASLSLASRVRGSLLRVLPPTWPGQKGWESQLQVRWGLSDSLMPQKCL